MKYLNALNPIHTNRLNMSAIFLYYIFLIQKSR